MFLRDYSLSLRFNWFGFVLSSFSSRSTPSWHATSGTPTMYRFNSSFDLYLPAGCCAICFDPRGFRHKICDNAAKVNPAASY